MRRRSSLRMTPWPTNPQTAPVIGSARSHIYPERARESSRADAMADIPAGMPGALQRAFPNVVFSRWNVDVDQAAWDSALKEAVPRWTPALMAALEEVGRQDHDDDDK